MTGEVTTDVAALRAGVRRVAAPRDVLRVEGPEAMAYLQGQCTQEVGALTPGRAVDAFLLEPTGTVDALVRIVGVAEETLVLDTDAGLGERVAERLARFRLRTKVEIGPAGWSALALRGPGSDEVLRAASAADGPPGPGSGCAVALAWAWGGVVGIDLLGPDPDAWLADALAGEVPPLCVPEAWEAVRIRAGVPGGGDLDEATVPAETGLLARAVSFTKGCYTGQELVARMDTRGNHAVRHLRGLVLGAPSGPGGPDPEVLAAEVVGAELLDPARDRVAGRITSAAHSPEEDRVVALALVHRSVAPGHRLVVVGAGLPGAPDGQAEVVELPAA